MFDVGGEVFKYNIKNKVELTKLITCKVLLGE